MRSGAGDKIDMIDIFQITETFDNLKDPLRKWEKPWVLAPAYDLLNVAIVLQKDTDELALTLTGKKKNLSHEHFEQLRESLKLTGKQAKGVFQRMIKNKTDASGRIDRSFLPDVMKTAYKDVLDSRYKQLGMTK